MMSRLTSKVSSRAQTVIPREVRDRLGLEPGDLRAHRYTKNGVVIETCELAQDDRFATACGEL
jgi:antitoxin PrlF